jgi:hypothetical protein
LSLYSGKLQIGVIEVEAGNGRELYGGKVEEVEALQFRLKIGASQHWKHSLAGLFTGGVLRWWRNKEKE